MRKHQVPLVTILTAVVALVCAPRPAWSWDSICVQFADPTADVADLSMIADSRGCEGALAARQRWRDPERHVDEHRQIFAAAVTYAGLPLEVLATTKWSVFVTDETVPQGTDSVPSVRPRRVTIFDTSLIGIKGTTRAFALDEFAQLPDFSYGLWDWASGNETCPLEYAANAEECHQFKTHMGAVNANHFPPQSDGWYRHYHQIAIDRATVCTSNRAAARDRASARGENPDLVDQNLRETWKACEVEALAYEAVAQHYLQDSWSAGHMWQRWGSTDLNTITNTFDGLGADWDATPIAGKRLLIAEVVAAIAGTIHGADGPFFEGAIAGISATLHDPMCYPDPDVRAVDGSGIFNVVGDLHLHEAVTTPDGPSHSDISSKPLFLSGIFDTSIFQTQGNKLIACAGGSVGEVYNVLVGPGGEFQPALGDAPSSPVPFNMNDCVAPMATNLGFFRGIYDRPLGILGLELTRGFLGTLVVTVLGPRLASLESLPAGLNTRATADYVELTSVAALRSTIAPNGTDLARDPRTMLGVSRNGAYSTTPPRYLADPPAVDADLPFGGSASDLELGTFPGTKAFWLTQTFRRSRAPEVCTHQLEAEFRVNTYDLVRAARAQPDRSTLSGEELKSYDAVCQACAEWVGAYLWNTNTWNGSRLTGAPLCSYAESYPQTATIDENSGAWGLEPKTVLTQPNGSDTRWFAHITTQNSSTGADAIPIGYDSPTNYIGGGSAVTPEEMAKLTCCAKLDTGGGTGNFRIHGTITGQPLDSTVTFTLRAEGTPEIDPEHYVPTYAQPLLAHLPTDDTTKASRVLWTDASERFGLTYEEDDPTARAVFDTGKAIVDDQGNGLRYHVGNPAKNWLPAAGTFILTPIMAMDEKRGEHCTFDPPSHTLTLDADNAEVWDVDFAMTCADDVDFHIGYPQPMSTWATVTRVPVEVPPDSGEEFQWVVGQRVYVKGPLTLSSLGVHTPHAGGGNVRMAVYKETAFTPPWSASATLVAQTEITGLVDGDNPALPTGDVTLDEGTYWIFGSFRGPDDGDYTSIGYSGWLVGKAWGAEFLLPLDAPFDANINLGSANLKYYHLNMYMNVR